VRAYGGLDAAHVNAGAMTMVPRDTDVVDIDLEVWDRTIAVNLRGHQGRHQRPGPARRRPVGQGRHPRQRHRAGPDPDPGDPGRRPAGHARQMLARTPSTRHGEAGDVAGLVAYLMSDAGSWINGQVISVDGGTIMR